MPQNRIRELRKARGLTLEQLAAAVGMSEPHLSRLEAGKRLLLVPVAERLAMQLQTTPAYILGLDAASSTEERRTGMAEDCVRYEPQPDDPLSALAGPNRYLYTVVSDVLDRVRLNRDDVVVVDASEQACKAVAPLALVVVRFHPREEFMKPVTLLRQFVPPSLLITNSSKGNEPSIDTSEDDAHIVGVVVGSHRRFG